MLPLQRFLLVLLLILSSGCSILSAREEKVVVQTKFTEQNIPVQPRPKPLSLSDIVWYVVTEENLDEFVKRYEAEEGRQWVFYALSVKSYENMAMNIADIRRYLKQQKAIILYYEEAVMKQKGAVK